MIEKVKNYLKDNNLLNHEEKVILGLSGGADSVCLLCVLSEILDKSNILAVHINHGIRDTATRDELFAKELCERKDIAFKAYHVDAVNYSKEHGISTEEAGRQLRYDCFKNAADEAGFKTYKIAVAHNMDDNAETLMINLFRGTGLKGMCGIPKSRDLVIRPLLCIRRKEIEAYLLSAGENFCTDETNLTDEYTRNKIRHNIIPYAAREINVKAVEKMGEFSEDVSLAEDFIETVVSENYSKTVSQNNNDSLEIDIMAIEGVHEYIKRRIIMEALGNLCGTKKDLANVHVESICNLMKLQVGRELDLPYSMHAIRQYGKVLISLNKKDIKLENEPLDSKIVIPVKDGDYKYFEYTVKVRIFDYNISMEIPTAKYTKWFDYDKITNGLCIRRREKGDVLMINSEGSMKKLKEFFINEKVPLADRDNIPLLAEGQHILWAVGYRISQAYKISNETKHVMEVEITK